MNKRWKLPCEDERQANIELSEKYMSLRNELEMLKELDELEMLKELVSELIDDIDSGDIGQAKKTLRRYGWG